MNTDGNARPGLPRSPLILLSLGLLLATTLLPPASAVYVRDDPLDSAWVTGHLERSSDVNRISWNGAFDTADSYLSPHPDAAKAPPDVEFVAAPLPWSLYLNASRNIQVDLTIKSSDVNRCRFTQNADAGIRVELWAGDRLLAGAIDGQSSTVRYEQQSADWATCRYRLAPEQRLLEKGTQLRLKIRYQAVGDPYEIGLSEAQPSVIRFSHYLPEDLFWRDPAFFQDTWRQSPDGASLIARILGVMQDVLRGLALPGAFAASLALPRRRSVPALIALALLMGGLSGCTSAHDRKNAGPTDTSLPDPGDLVTSTVQDGRGLQFSADGYGTILAVVSDAYLIPVAHAFVAVVGTDLSTLSNTNGRFQFLNVSAGLHHLRVDKDGYRSLEFDVKVEADKVTRLQVTLLEVDPKGQDARPHRHDYWRDRPVVEVFKGDVGWCDGIPETCGRSASFMIPPRPEEGADLVMPGTAEVELIASWSPERLGSTLMGLQVRHNADVATNRSVFYPRGPGQAFHIQTNWEMQDAGHQLFSTWTFDLVPDPYGDVPASPIDMADGLPFQVTMRLHRGIVGLEPAHPDHWKGLHNLTVEPGQVVKNGYMYGTSVASDLASSHPWTHCLLRDEGDGDGLNKFLIQWNPPRDVVPQSTKTVTVEISGFRDPRHASTGPYDVQLWWKPGDTPTTSFATWYNPYPDTESPHAADPAFRLAAAPTWSSDGKTATWKLAIDDHLADGTYNKFSSWQFATKPTDKRNACLDAAAHSQTDPAPEYRLRVEAERPLPDPA